MFGLFLADLFVPEADPDISASSGVLPVLQVLFGIPAVKSGTRNEIWGLRGSLMFRRLCLHSPGSLLPPVAPHLLALFQDASFHLQVHGRSRLRVDSALELL